ncbi:hypothetical protein [Marinobacter sp. F4216]|uniref:hypothetical protein n=1 Tax=Marinobacter sp. F4216 TaxID=2874281 RepID=UPI001CBD17A7|nr:hypothetical protein [Marinobacter sp. F4216]MBZ2168791.1 hypothetical protein [Marinobacter sp. F4216]
MRRIQKIGASAGLLLASANVLAHSGHEAIGNVLHVEYIFAAGIVGAIVLTAYRKVSERNED